MQPSIGHGRVGTHSLLLALALAAACGDSTGPTGTPADTPARGSIQVLVTTTGADVDPDGYLLAIDDSAPTQPVGVNGTTVVRDVPAGTHTVWLKGIATNCMVTARDPNNMYGVTPITLGAGGSPSVAYSVSCFTRSIPPALGATQLLFVRDGQFYRVRADGTGLVMLGSGYDPTWSPDGQRVAFSRDFDLYVMDADGANVQRVGGNPGVGASWPTWSPDGRRLAYNFVHIDGVEYEEVPQTTAVVSLDGASAPVIIPHSYAPAWSPDGSRIAFGVWGTVTGAGTGVWTVAPDGSDRRELLPGRDVNWAPAVPAWSPDGKRIAFAGYDGITVMNADGSNRRVLFSVRGTADRPAWSPDGQVIVFSVGNTVFYVTADGSTTGLLLENGNSPSWHK